MGSLRCVRGSALSFYPECPGSLVCEIGSPIFSQSRITIEDVKVFTIVAEGVSAKNKYIQSAALNGKLWSKPWFSHADIANGGILCYGWATTRIAPGEAGHRIHHHR